VADDELRVDREFLVAYDYGMGGLWGILMAPSAQAISARYPELIVVAERPEWMDDERYERLRGEPLWLDDDHQRGCCGP
jgi:hypothetical protein